MITAIIAGASTLKKLLPQNKKDPERVATAQANLTKALAGDATALAASHRRRPTEVLRKLARMRLARSDAYAAQTNNLLRPSRNRLHCSRR
jgi:hypothetical protein